MKRAAYAAFALGVALLALLILRADWTVLLHALKSFGIAGLLVLVAFHLPVIAAAGVAWWYFGRGVPGATLGGFVRARLVRDSVAAALPFSQIGGFAAGIRVLTVTGVPAVFGGFSMFADLIGEFAALFPYIAIGLIALYAVAPHSGLLRPLVIGAVAVEGVLIGGWIERRRVANWFGAPIMAIVGRFTGAERNAFPKFRDTAGRLDLSGRALAANLALHFGRWAIGAVETWLAFLLMGVPISLSSALVIDCISAALRIFAFMVPAVIGVQEGVYVLVCGIVGLPPAIALAFSFVWRARDLLIGFLGLALWHAVETSAPAKRNEAAPSATTSNFQGA
ncbi:MAG TPA: lysylphosphatidylglycerol synthase domain-containing protein [Rhizomicrobium sp.]|jgi:putative membrane protein|nr:lysylphosphatidylglycerol synthase domain-containing protein [Rhizomicrobium sp.]